ncbi:hypothetical protein V3O24_12840 [Methylobacter sp. Wu8]|uniref:hypothetical protein n=1 Tax=Methylobacter sp. Wu8 TaxID=3118457 RepID=UPI002F34057A
MAKRKQQSLIKGNANHSRTEGDYMSTLLDTVSLEDWQDVVNSTLAAAKQGDAQARAWLAQYLVGKPAGKAPTPLTVVVQQLNGDNPLVNKLANQVINQHKYPALHEDDAWEDQIKAIIATELAEKIPALKTISNPDTARLSENFDYN